MLNLPNLKGKTILQVLPALDTGGVERGTIEVAQAIHKAGGKAIVVSNGGQLVKDLNKVKALHLHAPVHSKNPKQIIKNISKLRQIIREYKVDLVHVRSRAPAWSVYFACKKEKIPFLATFHGTYKHQGLLGLKRFYNAIMLKGKCIIANSQFMANHLKSIYGVKSNFIRIIPRGVDTLVFDPLNVTNAKILELKKAWKISHFDFGKPILLLPGRLTRWKGQLHFLKALDHLKNKLDMTDFIAVLVGSDQGREKYSAELRDFIQQHNLHSHVHIVNHCSVMPVAYDVAKFVISASIEPEAFGRVMIEAGAMERPVIATNHGGAQEIITQGHTGWLVEPHSVEAMAQALHKALCLPEKKYNQMCQKARQRVEKYFSKDQFIAKTLHVYEEIFNYHTPFHPKELPSNHQY